MVLRCQWLYAAIKNGHLPLRRQPLRIVLKLRQIDLFISSVLFLYGVLIGAHIAAAHQPFFIKFPMLVAMGAVPLTTGLAPFVFKTNRNAVVGITPQLLH